MSSSDAENLAFYNRHYEELSDRNVYIMLEDISRQNIENPLISVFSIAENCARQYWKAYRHHRLWKRGGGHSALWAPDESAGPRTEL